MRATAILLALAACVEVPEARPDRPADGVYVMGWRYVAGPAHLSPDVVGDGALRVDGSSALFFDPGCGPACEYQREIVPDGRGAWVIRGGNQGDAIRVTRSPDADLDGCGTWPGGIEWCIRAILFQEGP